ncbi:MAG: Flp pilus assembly complex ATPase component TadA [Candidatus Riflebacteria bacterium]|nr:Flp pilus assembly complex ATPase component TadA [Candidatus Riflebacteria bacterium]
MDEDLFKSHFPAFPCNPEDLQKLGVILREKKILEKDAWDKLRVEKPEGAATISAVAGFPQIKAKDLAEIEASLLNCPFIDLEMQQIASDVFKIFKIEIMIEHKVIPIRINGQELLVGMLAPGDATTLKTLGGLTTLAIKPAKMLFEQFEKKLRQTADSKKGGAPPQKKGPRKRLGDILIEAKFLTDEQLKGALDESKKDKLRLGAYLVKKGLLTNKQLSVALSRQFDIPFIDLEESLVDPILATLLPKKLCYDQILCPVKKEENRIVVAMTDPTDIITIDHIEMMTGLRISPVVSSEIAIISALDKLYGESIDALGDKIGNNMVDVVDDLGDLGEDAAPIIKLVNLFISQAAQTGVSDIHIEPFENELRIRFRKDGVMKLYMTPNKAATPGIVSRIKVMSNLDIAETRKPQDGRIKMSMGEKKIDLRVSIVPVAWGEKVCMRLLDQGNLKVNLADLGFEPHVLDLFMSGVKQPNGIVLVTGPTGSGKTTTLYSSLFLLNNPGVNIMTAEDPVEYNLMGINQVQCHADIGLDFAAALRSFLRQDPNIIMIGEIRDFETASIAVKAAMTGHLVISTLHTNDAPSTVSRLLNMGIEPFALTTSLRVVEAQRLVRKICKSCYTEYKPTIDQLKTLGIDEKLMKKLRLTDMDIGNLVFAKGAGCQECDSSGYKGRQGIYEVLAMSGEFRSIVEKKGSPEDMRRQAIADGMVTLRESGLYKLLTKRTTIEEVVRATMDGGGDDSKPEKKPSGAKIVSIADTSIATASGAGALSTIGFDTITTEMKAFRSTLAKLAGDTGPMITIENETLKANITDPLAQMQAQIVAGLTGKDIAKLLPTIHAQGQKMDFNLKNMVSHFSNTLFKPVKSSVNDLIEREILGTLKNFVILSRILSNNASIGQGLKVTKNLSANLPPIVIDPEIFRQIAANIVVNALMSMPKGGEIKLMTRLKPNSKGRVEMALFDNGHGIPTEAQAKLFVPFTPIGRKTLGLGLAVVKKLIEQAGGAISINSTPGKNTLVIVEFPAVI